MGVECMVLISGSIVTNGLNVDYQEFKRLPRRPFGNIIPFTALKDVNLEVEPGEIVAILGRNGAGKSTLLKCISGFLRASGGIVETSGRVFLLAGADPGLMPMLSGRQNAREMGTAYGVPAHEIDDFVSSVDEFASLNEDFDRNVGGYSTGMRGKLGFGIITALVPDILLIDETLGVGDREFRAKAEMRLRDFIGQSGTVLISTHSLGFAKELCSRGVVLDEGKVRFDGPVDEAIKEYISFTD
jgi:ABC-type polysaccharide/polyol phosphate transport system ATPase subunit